VSESVKQTPIGLHRALDAIWANPGGIGRLTIVNHSVIGKRFMFTGFFFFLVGGLLAMLIRAQLATSGSAFLSSETYSQVFTMHGTIMMFLFAIPVIEGFALYLLPKILGARDLAFPRLSAFGYFCYVFGGSILLVAMAIGVAPDSGWFMYTPLSSKTFTPGVNADVWLIGVTFVEISALAIGIELAATILTMRAGGMALQRMPLFGWYMLVTAFMIILAFPPLILASILLELERAFDWPFFLTERGGDPLLWQHLFWLFGHPEVYIIFIPAAGLVSTMIPTFARRPIIGYTAIVVALVAMGFLSFGLWVHHMYVVGIPHLGLAFFSAASMLVAIPTAVQFFAWIATLWDGRPYVRLPMLYLFGFFIIFILGGLTGVMVALVPFDWQAHDTHFVVAHMHYVLVGGFVFPILGATYYWMPHLTGKMPSEQLGKWAFWLIFIGFNVTFFVMHLTGLMGMPRRVYTYPEAFGWDTLNAISSVGGFIMTAGIALFMLDVVMHARFGAVAGRNPWQAGTLDWGMLTPPPNYNFSSLPHTSSRDPLWDEPKIAADMAAGRHYLGIPRNNWQETLGIDPMSGEPRSIVVLPGPSWFPLACAAAMAVFFVSFLLGIYWMAAVGAVLALFLFLGWAWRTGLNRDPEPMQAGRGLELPLHTVTEGAPGWWGMCFTLVADATFFASLLFGYLFLWAIAPGWPPPSFIEFSPLAIAAIVAGSLIAAYAARACTARMETTIWWLAIAALASIAAVIAFLSIGFGLVESPTSHAYDATVSFISVYAAFHSGLAAILALYLILRLLSGYISRARDLELRVFRMWCGFTAAINLILAFFLFAFPPWVAA
jgi:cytochrome c oxidase subunit I+III